MCQAMRGEAYDIITNVTPWERHDHDRLGDRRYTPLSNPNRRALFSDHGKKLIQPGEGAEGYEYHHDRPALHSPVVEKKACMTREWIPVVLLSTKTY